MDSTTQNAQLSAPPQHVAFYFAHVGAESARMVRTWGICGSAGTLSFRMDETLRRYHDLNRRVSSSCVIGVRAVKTLHLLRHPQVVSSFSALFLASRKGHYLIAAPPDWRDAHGATITTSCSMQKCEYVRTLNRSRAVVSRAHNPLTAVAGQCALGSGLRFIACNLDF
jgi:hypothetical protein